ncbi:MAG: hypothetical protein HPY83_07630 [Anaerolineae bacterium]|nr:hypothetical protein [Anaerolineae bacterium]
MDTEQFAWREIIARVFEGLEIQRDPSPPWLINPDTRRPLKLNYLLPEVGLAIRTEGLRGRQQRRGPDEQERQQQEEREAIRERLCEERGIRLLRFDVYDEPADVFRALNSALAWAARRAATSDLEPERKLALMEKLRQARQRSDEIRATVRTPRDLQTWADLWVDRAYREARSAPVPSAPSEPIPRYALHMRVKHPDFGPGRVTALSDENGDQIVTVRFDNGEERQFLAQLVVDKLRPC